MNAWQSKTLGEVCQFINRGISPTYADEGGIAVLNQKCVRGHQVNFDLGRRHNVQAKKVSTDRLLRAGDVLVNSTGTGTLGRVAQLREDPLEATTTDSHVTIVRPAENLFHRDFFGYALIAIEDQIQEGGEGCGGQTELSRAKLAGDYQVSFPSDIDQQRRIVAILDEAFEGIATAKANAEKNLQGASELYERYVEAAFFGALEGELETTLSEVTGGIFTGPFGSLLHKSDYVQDGIPLVNPAHITETGIEPDSRKTVTPATAQRLSSYMMQVGDIVIGRRGEMGRCALITEVEEGWLCGTGSFIVKGSTRCDPRYLVRFLRSSACKRRLEKIAGGAVMPNLSNTDLGNLTLKLPSIDRQLAIVQEIDALVSKTERLKSIYQRKLAALDALKKSLLHQAFSGRL